MNDELYDSVTPDGHSQRTIIEGLLKITTVRGPWFSLGFHVDFQKKYMEIHFIWWIVTIGQDLPFEVESVVEWGELTD